MPSGIPTLAASRRQLARHPKRVKKQGMSRLVCYLSQAIAAHDPGKQSSLEDGLWAVAYPTWSDAPGRGMLRDAGVLDCLVDILRAEQGTFSGLAVQRAAQAVEQFVRLDWAASCRLFDLGIIRRLVDLLDLGPNQIATEAAIRTLHMYAAQMHSIKDLIVASGAVKVLVKLMQDAFVAHNYLILKEVAWVFICLADTDELCKDALREGGAIEQLVRLLQHRPFGSILTAHMNLAALAARALHVLAQASHVNQERICRLGAIPYLAALLHTNPEARVDAAADSKPSMPAGASSSKHSAPGEQLPSTPSTPSTQHASLQVPTQLNIIAAWALLRIMQDQAIAHSSGGHLYRGTSLPSDAVAEEGPRDDEDDLCIDVDYFCRRSQRRDWSAASTEMLVRVLGAGPCLLEARKEAAGALRALAAGNKLAKEFSMHAGVLQNVMQLLMSSAGGQGTGSGQRSLAWEAAEILSVLTDDNPDQQAAISKAGVVQGLVTVLKGLLEDPAASRTSMPLPSSTTPKALASIRVAAEPASPATAATPGSSSAAVHAAASPATPTRVGPSLPLHIHNTPGPPGSPACPIKRTDAEASDQDVTLSDHASPAQIPVIQEPQEDPADLPNSSHLGAEVRCAATGNRGPLASTSGPATSAGCLQQQHQPPGFHQSSRQQYLHVHSPAGATSSIGSGGTTGQELLPAGRGLHDLASAASALDGQVGGAGAQGSLPHQPDSSDSTGAAEAASLTSPTWMAGLMHRLGTFRITDPFTSRFGPEPSSLGPRPDGSESGPGSSNNGPLRGSWAQPRAREKSRSLGARDTQHLPKAPLADAGMQAGSRGLARTQSEQLRSPTKRQISMLSALKEAPIKDARPAVQRPLGLIKAAASTLLNLVDHSSANQDTVRSLGGLTLATDLLRLALDLGLERGLVAVAAGLVRALADGSPANQSALGEAGTVALLLEVLKAAAQSSSSEATAAKHRAIWALQSLVDESPMNQAALREAGGLQLLVEQLALRAQAGAGPVIEEDLQAYYAEDPGRLAADVESATAASWALGTAVAEDRASQDLLRDVGGMLPLLTLLRDCREGKARMGVLWALGNLVKGNPACQAAVMHNDGIILLVSLFEKGPLAREAEGAAWTLHNVVEGNPRCKEAAREAGAIPALVRLLGGGPDSVVTECAARTLHALAEDNPLNQDEICVAGSLEPLVMILGSGSDKLGAKSAALAIGSLVKRHPINQNAVRRAGGVGFLVNLLRAGPMNRAAVYAAHAIGHLVAENRINQDAVHDAGGVELMVRLLKGGLGLGIETRTSLAATRAIAALTDGHPSNKAAAMAAGAGEALAQCLARMALVSGDLAAHLVLLETAAHACTAIANLSSGSPPAQDAFRTMGCAELLVRLLAGPSMMVVQEASRGLASLAAGCPSNQAAVANAGGVEFLVGVLQHQTQDDAESMQAAASILHAILVATNPANHEVRKRAVDPAGPPDPSDTEEAQAEATANGMLGNGLSSDPHRFAESGAAADRGEPEKPLHDAGFAFVAMFLQEGSTRAVKEQAASALFQLAQGNPANRRAIYELAAAGVIPLAEQLVHFQDRLRSAASNKPSILHLLANCGQAFGGFAA